MDRNTWRRSERAFANLFPGRMDARHYLADKSAALARALASVTTFFTELILGYPPLTHQSLVYRHDKENGEVIPVEDDRSMKMVV